MADPAISLPETLRDWAQARVAERGYASTSDYVGDLVRRDREAEEKLRRLQAAIDEGLASGISEQDPFDYLHTLGASLEADDTDADATWAEPERTAGPR